MGFLNNDVPTVSRPVGSSGWKFAARLCADGAIACGIVLRMGGVGWHPDAEDAFDMSVGNFMYGDESRVGGGHLTSTARSHRGRNCNVSWKRKTRMEEEAILQACNPVLPVGKTRSL
uniref:Uncharacterized protein n=1 Tax=Hyaloperonospora arabidopsidis (strain Emoy2) TaxID=559515 RepID=M4BSP2_HYAAE